MSPCKVTEMNLTTASSQEHVDRHECRRDEGEGEREDGDGGARAGGNCIKIGLPGKLILIIIINRRLFS